MTTHFTSGVTNVSSTGTSSRLKMPAPQKYHTYFNDFNTYLASDWTITTTEGGSGNASEASAMATVGYWSSLMTTLTTTTISFSLSKRDSSLSQRSSLPLPLA